MPQFRSHGHIAGHPVLTLIAFQFGLWRQTILPINSVFRFFLSTGASFRSFSCPLRRRSFWQGSDWRLSGDLSSAIQINPKKSIEHSDKKGRKQFLAVFSGVPSRPSHFEEWKQIRTKNTLLREGSVILLSLLCVHGSYVQIFKEVFWVVWEKKIKSIQTDSELTIKSDPNAWSKLLNWFEKLISPDVNIAFWYFLQTKNHPICNLFPLNLVVRSQSDSQWHRWAQTNDPLQ